MSTQSYYQVYLSEELARRHRRNPRYSTRAFAKMLEVDVASVSRILSGKQIPSYKICQTLFTKLDMSPEEQNKFLMSVVFVQKSRGKKRMSPHLRKFISLGESRIDIKADLWRAIADWRHGAIMELTFVDDFVSDPKWMAQRLGISIVEVESVVQRLLRLKLLEKKDGIYRKTHEQVASADKTITTPAHKKLQRQVLKKAIHSLENNPLEVRNMTSMAMAIDPELLPQAKALIQEFARNLCTLLESGKRSQVYQLGVCLYPISKKEGDLK